MNLQYKKKNNIISDAIKNNKKVLQQAAKCRQNRQSTVEKRIECDIEWHKKAQHNCPYRRVQINFEAIGTKSSTFPHSR